LRVGLSLFKKFKGSELAKNSMLFTLFNYLNAIIPFLLVPFLTRKLEPDQYGIIASYGILINGVAPFISLSLTGLVYKIYSEDNSASSLGGRLLNIIFLNVVSTVLVLIILYFFNYQIIGILKVPFEWVLNAVFFALGQCIISIQLCLWQIEKRILSFGFLIITQSLINISATFLVFYLQTNHTFESRLYPQFFTILLFATIVIFKLSSKYLSKVRLTMFYNKAFIGRCLNFGIPLLPHALSGLLLNYFDKILIAKNSSLGDIGMYNLAYQLGLSVYFLGMSINMAFIPWLYERLKNSSDINNNQIVKVTYLVMMLFIGLGALGSLLSSNIVHLLVGEKYYGITAYLNYFIWAYIFNSLYFLFTNYSSYFEKTKKQAIASVCSTFIGISFTYFLYHRYGLKGAAMGSMFSFFFLFIATWGLSYIIYPLNWFKFLYNGFFKKNN
jgi:O-antigen/teichoic acid export membrane protein